jgi:hypothetical protein
VPIGFASEAGSWPWSSIEAYSDRRPPTYVGASPYEMRIEGKRGQRPALPEHLLPLLRKQLKQVHDGLGLESVELELWPSQNDWGWSWVYARWRGSPRDPWRWLSRLSDLNDVEGDEPPPIFPERIRLDSAENRSRVFDDFLELDDLYAKPVFGDCLWIDSKGKPTGQAWLGDSERADMARRLGRGRGTECLLLPQPARFNDREIRFVIRSGPAGIRWDQEPEWKPGIALPPASPRVPLVPRMDGRLDSEYRDDVLTLAGEKTARFPLSGRTLRFTRKSTAQPDHQLEDLVDYLEERYSLLGLETRRMRFRWRDIPQSNLIAVIPGSLPAGENRPIILADHIDTAFAEDIFARTGQRVAVPGADDNVTATAALLSAARQLRGLALKHDVWLVHLTGEEFPADCLGSRKLVSRWLDERQAIGGVLLMDMIGYRTPGDDVIQINPGDSERSAELAAVARDLVPVVSPGLRPATHGRFDPRSYLYNTDGVTFSDLGFPVVLLDEHINALENLNRPHYHDSTDTSRYVDFDFALSVTRVAIETAAQLAASDH